jgi:hypothetical protein
VGVDVQNLLPPEPKIKTDRMTIEEYVVGPIEECIITDQKYLSIPRRTALAPWIHEVLGTTNPTVRPRPKILPSNNVLVRIGAGTAELVL